MTFKKITSSVKTLVSDVTDTIKESGIIDKAAHALKDTYSKIEDTIVNASKKEYDNIEFIERENIVVEERITLADYGTYEELLEDLQNKLDSKYINSYTFYYSDGTQIQDGDLVYSFKNKQFVEFKKSQPHHL